MGTRADFEDAKADRVRVLVDFLRSKAKAFDEGARDADTDDVADDLRREARALHRAADDVEAVLRSQEGAVAMTAPPSQAMPPSKRALQRILRQWRAVPVGTPVVVHREAGPPLLTRTRCRPYLLDDGTPAILVRDMEIHVPLWRIELAPSEKL